MLRRPDTLSAVPPGSPGRTTIPKNNNQPRLNYYPDIHTSKDSINLMKKPCTFSSCHVRSLALFSEVCLRSPNGQISLSPRHPKSTQAQNCIVNPLFSRISALSMTYKVRKWYRTHTNLTHKILAAFWERQNIAIKFLWVSNTVCYSIVWKY